MKWLRGVWKNGISPTFMRRFHAGATLVFLVLIPPSMVLWAQSVPYLVAISVWANFAGHLSAWQAARVEVRQDEIEKKADDAKEAAS